MRELFTQVDHGAEPVWPIEVRADLARGLSAFAIAAAIGAGFGLLCGAGRLLSQDSNHVATFFAANGVLTAFLLCRPRNSWWKFLLAAWLGDAVSILILGGPLGLCGIVAFCNVTECLIAASLLHLALRRNHDLASPATMGSFLLFAVLLAPAISALLASLYYHAAFGHDIWLVFSRRFPPYALGMAIMTPLTLGICGGRIRALFGPRSALRTMGILLLILASSILIFEQTHYSLRFLWLPLLMLVVFEVGILGAVMATFEILVVAAIYTLHGAGPFWMQAGSTLQHSVLLLQATVLVLFVSVVPFAVAIERQRRLRTQLRLGMERYRLLADNSRDIVVLANLEGRRLYVSPAVQDVLGWTPEEWADRDAADFMHRDDLGPFQRMLKEMLRGQDRRTFRYRTQHKDGRYLWMEASIRTLPDEITGEPKAFVANVRDISERVESEEKLAVVHRQMQQQAERDSLTQLANRRCFDEALEREWRRGRRTGSPLALLMVDIDHFKRINDTYGHRAGDQCLQAIAGVLRDVARRPSDLIARYGGEEFAMLLPDVSLEAAKMMADLLCLKMREQMFEAGIGRTLALTVSVGVAALLPYKGSRADQLVEAADRALYAAKQGGRDRVVHQYLDTASEQLLHHVQ